VNGHRCPPGAVPEQFRIWEALEGGAIPIVLRRNVESSDGTIGYMRDLALDAVASLRPYALTHPRPLLSRDGTRRTWMRSSVLR
jgi:hypothetical protein